MNVICPILVPGPQSSRLTCNSPRCISVDAACSCVTQVRHRVSASRENINEQIATVLLRLQHDMTDVLHRLHMLEQLTRSQVKDHCLCFWDQDWTIFLCAHMSMTIAVTIWFYFVVKIIFTKTGGLCTCCTKGTPKLCVHSLTDYSVKFDLL